VGGSQADDPLGVGKALERRPGSLPGITAGKERWPETDLIVGEAVASTITAPERTHPSESGARATGSSL
jgi:hypothetical protein